MTMFELLGLDGNFVVLNMLLQVSIFATVALVVAMRFKHNAAIRYAILYPAMLSLLVLVAASVAMQTGEKNLLYIPLASANLQSPATLNMNYNGIAATTFAARELASTGRQVLELEVPGPTIFVSLGGGMLASLWRWFFFIGLRFVA